MNLTRILITAALTAGAAAPAGAETICHSGGGNDVTIILKVAEDADPVRLAVDQGYFDQRFIPRSGSERDALGLYLDATDFSPWPSDVRAHQSEGPYLSLLITSYLPFELIAERSATTTLGYRLADEVAWQELEGPHGLKIFTAPPPPDQRRGGLIGDYDVYISRDASGSITDIVNCRRPGETPFTQCEHLIEQGTEDLKLRYSTDLLPNWHRYSENAREFFACLQAD